MGIPHTASRIFFPILPACSGGAGSRIHPAVLKCACPGVLIRARLGSLILARLLVRVFFLTVSRAGFLVRVRLAGMILVQLSFLPRPILILPLGQIQPSGDLVIGILKPLVVIAGIRKRTAVF